MILEDSEDFKMFKTSNQERSPTKSTSMSSSNRKDSFTNRRSTRSSRMNDSQKRGGYNSANINRSRATGSKLDSGLGKIPELNESDYKQNVRSSGSSSERPKKAVKFDLIKNENTLKR